MDAIMDLMKNYLFLSPKSESNLILHAKQRPAATLLARLPATASRLTHSGITSGGITTTAHL
jgi:hypothetical protein